MTIITMAEDDDTSVASINEGDESQTAIVHSNGTTAKEARTFPTDPQTHSPFFRLPPELREEIYKYLVQGRERGFCAEAEDRYQLEQIFNGTNVENSYEHLSMYLHWPRSLETVLEEVERRENCYRIMATCKFILLEALPVSLRHCTTCSIGLSMVMRVSRAITWRRLLAACSTRRFIENLRISLDAPGLDFRIRKQALWLEFQADEIIIELGKQATIHVTTGKNSDEREFQSERAKRALPILDHIDAVIRASGEEEDMGGLSATRALTLGEALAIADAFFHYCFDRQCPELRGLYDPKLAYIPEPSPIEDIWRLWQTDRDW